MGKKRPDRTARRAREQQVKKLVRATEKLAHAAAGGSKDHPIEVPSSTVIEIRVHAMRCPQCEGTYALVDHRSAGQGIRPVDVRCNVCGTPRTLWFQIVEPEPN
jgi:predicted Zn finger-like uncharacterized protein